MSGKNKQSQERASVPTQPWVPVMNRIIIPFVDPIAANGRVLNFSQEDRIRSRCEAAVELILVAAGAAGVVMAVMAGLR
jgi:hypothetical protein